jgi:hypothetical protein
MLSVDKLQVTLSRFVIGKFETAVCRNINNKDKCLMDFCKEKITVFPEGALFAKALMSALLIQTVG